MRIAIIGGGAAGVFAALIAKATLPSSEVTVYERTQHLLTKVKISGGGRCNVTHSCFDPKDLTAYYPRGQKELLGPFHRFQPADMIQWLSKRGVELKTEEDGRIFPVTDSSQTIIDCFLKEAKSLGVNFSMGTKIEDIVKEEKDFVLSLSDSEIRADILILATGSHPDGQKIAVSLGHTVIPPVPSLFTFNLPSSPLLDLAGISVEQAEGSIDGFPLKLKGPLLLTHWGFSGPMILKLSAFAARFLHEKNYKATVRINWLGMDEKDVFEELLYQKNEHPKKLLSSTIPLPKNLSKMLLSEEPLFTLKNEALRKVAHQLTNDLYQMEGKTTYKQEFVTAGGVDLKEVDLRTLESRKVKGLYFAGEVLNIDGVTGGFNFQNAWTTAWTAAHSLSLL